MAARLTAKGAATKQRIVEAAALLIREKGASETSLDDILSSTGTNKSQIFHYWPDGRNGLFLDVARHEADQVIAVQQPYLDDLSSWTVWEQWRDAVVHHYEELGERCPLGALISELGSFSPDARQVVRDLHTGWEAALTRGVVAVCGKDSAIATDTAQSILAAVQGGVVMLRSSGRTAYLEAALDAALRPVHQESVAAV